MNRRCSEVSQHLRVPRSFFTTSVGCRFGSKCRFRHGQEAQAELGWADESQARAGRRTCTEPPLTADPLRFFSVFSVPILFPFRVRPERKPHLMCPPAFRDSALNWQAVDIPEDIPELELDPFAVGGAADSHRLEAQLQRLATAPPLPPSRMTPGAGRSASAAPRRLVVTLGDGDLSFSAALLRDGVVPPAMLVATVLGTEAQTEVCGRDSLNQVLDLRPPEHPFGTHAPNLGVVRGLEIMWF